MGIYEIANYQRNRARHEELSGPFNATTPNPITMEQFAKALGEVLNRLSWFAVPVSVLALPVGEMADMLFAGQHALPEAAMKRGYGLKFPKIKTALRSLDLLRN